MKVYIVADPNDSVLLLTTHETTYNVVKEQCEEEGLDIQLQVWDTDEDKSIKIQLKVG